jgi:hypothetical protein
MCEHSQTHVGGGGVATCRCGGGAINHISIESSKSEEGGGAVRRWRLELPTSCICKGGGAVWRRLELPISWWEGFRAMWLKGEANLP